MQSYVCKGRRGQIESCLVSRYSRKCIAALEGYSPGEQPQNGEYIKLNTNENPYPPSPRVGAALRKAAGGPLRLYPDPLAADLRRLAAAAYGVKPENVLAGNGSDELLSIVVRCFIGKGDRVVYPVPTYTLYDTLITIQEGKKVTVNYPSDFSLPEALFNRAGAVTILCNPNSPSGTLLPLDQIRQLARRASGILVVDEAYMDFAEGNGSSAIPLIRRLPNLVVLRSFSKSFSLAGMRIGLAFTAEEILREMLKVKDSYNLNRLSTVSAIAALKDMPWMSRNVKKIQKTRRALALALEKLGFSIYPSQANFVMARKRNENLKGLYEKLKRRRILVRYFDEPGLRDALRITVGTPKEIKRLLGALTAIVKKS